MASATSCSAARISSQSPTLASMPCISALRPKLAAKPMATPASAAPSSGPAFSPHEKALRFCDLPPFSPVELRFELLLRLDGRFWVRVDIDFSLAGFGVSTVGEEAPFRSRSCSANRSTQWLDAVAGFLRRRRRGLIAGFGRSLLRLGLCDRLGRGRRKL